MSTAALEYLDARQEALAERIEADALSDPHGQYNEATVYLRSLRRYPVIRDPERIAALVAEAHAGNRDAFDLLVYSNIRLVVSIANKYSWRGMPISDLIQEGVFGLFKAIEKFDPNLGFRLSTFAMKGIRRAIERALDDWIGDQPYRIPVGMQTALRAVRGAMSAFMGTYGRWPDTRELYETVQTFDSKVAQGLRLVDLAHCRNLIVDGHTASLDASPDPAAADDDLRMLGAYITDPSTDLDVLIEAREMLMEYRAALANVERIVATLPPRLAMIVRLRLGMGEFDRLTLKEVGERYELTYERIRQLEAQAFQQLSTALNVEMDDIVALMETVEELERIVAAGTPEGA